MQALALLVVAVLCSSLALVNGLGWPWPLSTVLGASAPKVGPVCYNTEKLGCFDPFVLDDSFPVGVFKNIPPASPHDIGVKFHMYTCENRHRPVIFEWDTTEEQLKNSSLQFDPTKKTIFIVHGYRDYFDEYNWNGDMKDFILNNQNRVSRECKFNVIGVDWHNGSMVPFYHNAAANTMMVGAVIAQYINKLTTVYGQTPDDFILVGHSLGAHICGFAGKRFQQEGKKLRLILGLDPAGPLFYHNTNMTKLDPNDASLVVTIHTNAGDHIGLEAFGIKLPLGHYAFFPNGGEHQVGCGKSSKDVIAGILTGGSVATALTDAVACSHRRATQIVQFNESLSVTSNSMAFKCGSYIEFLNGECASCATEFDCVPFHSWFNYWVNKRLDPGWIEPRVYYIDTTDKAPYAAYLYLVTMEVSAIGSNPFVGSAEIVLKGKLRDSTRLEFLPLDKEIKVGKFSKLVKVHKELGPITSVSLKLNPSKTFETVTEANFKISQITVDYLSSRSAEDRAKESRVLKTVPDVLKLTTLKQVEWNHIGV